MAPGVGGDAPGVLAILWSLTALAFVFVLLRLYTRLKLLHAYGLDDHFYNLAFCLFLGYDIMLQISSHYGFGRTIAEIGNLDDVTQAILYEAIGQTMLVTGVFVAKLSLGLFLLRLVTDRYHQVAILAPAIILSISCILALFVFWFSCTPISYLWDRRILGGFCKINPGPVSVHAGIWSVIVDFWYAGFPWYLMWKLQMPRREKIIIASSMSLGVIAGACGIRRALELKNLASTDYLKDTVGMIVWHAAEVATTMICIGIPVCLPLYKHMFETITSRRDANTSSSGYERQHESEGGDSVFGLHTIGGTPYCIKKSDGCIDRTGKKLGESNVVVLRQSVVGRTESDNDSAEAILEPQPQNQQRPINHGHERPVSLLSVDGEAMPVKGQFEIRTI